MFQVVLCTCPNKILAEEIAKVLVSEQLAACVNIMPGVTSIYQWQGKIEQDEEVMLLIKTSANLFGKLSNKIKQLHSYDVPEIVALDIQQGDEGYLDWITGSLK
ncbi:divalent-cation tolerance protein CutA [Thalassotalea sp. M1531]|uniref:Divalent-cation tolerance protein CutA n=1 Tax=Thalassotalea algicola TaxID=2716224 RepID=A0A7Y0LCR4_9GAMM|nr:divalent-cation tolerance protein CutA [Thalassotalea algicola]NMP31769.1 divalent-cation tolerance protein CutA [Thalassotalea algicola]